MYNLQEVSVLIGQDYNMLLLIYYSFN